MVQHHRCWVALLKRRYLHKFLTDVTICASNASPYGLTVPDNATLDELFKWLSHTLQVGSVILDDDFFWSVVAMLCHVLEDFRDMHGGRIRESTDPAEGQSSGDLALTRHCGYACNSWVADIKNALTRSSPARHTLIKWRLLQATVGTSVVNQFLFFLCVNGVRICLGFQNAQVPENSFWKYG